MQLAGVGGQPPALSQSGYGDYDIYGISYGTKLALEVMRSAPEGVRSVVIDGVFPPNARAYDTNILPVQEGLQ
jgi:pimeloyl-ACP methyl ester carboxylesterase